MKHLLVLRTPTKDMPDLVTYVRVQDVIAIGVTPGRLYVEQGSSSWEAQATADETADILQQWREYLGSQS